jgi:hypothetical protein
MYFNSINNENIESSALFFKMADYESVYEFHRLLEKGDNCI